MDEKEPRTFKTSGDIDKITGWPKNLLPLRAEATPTEAIEYIMNFLSKEGYYINDISGLRTPFKILEEATGHGDKKAHICPKFMAAKESEGTDIVIIPIAEIESIHFGASFATVVLKSGREWRIKMKYKDALEMFSSYSERSQTCKGGS